jgi:hypothetical protein
MRPASALTEQERIMTSALPDAGAPRCANTAPRRAVLRLLALAAGSVVVTLRHAETQASGKSQHHNGGNGGNAGLLKRVQSAPTWHLWDDMSNVTGGKR